MTSLVAAQALAEVIAADASPPVRVAQLVAEGIAANPAAPLRVAQVIAEAVAANPAAPLRVAQLLAEAVIATTPPPPPLPPADLDPTVYLSWSDDRGRTFSDPVGASLGAVGEYLTQVQWRRLGMGRDRVFAVEWSASVATALQGAWVEATPAES